MPKTQLPQLHVSDVIPYLFRDSLSWLVEFTTNSAEGYTERTAEIQVGTEETSCIPYCILFMGSMLNRKLKCLHV